MEAVHGRDSISLEKELFGLLASMKKLHVFKSDNFWSSIKSAGYRPG